MNPGGAECGDGTHACPREPPLLRCDQTSAGGISTAGPACATTTLEGSHSPGQDQRSSCYSLRIKGPRKGHTVRSRSLAPPSSRGVEESNTSPSPLKLERIQMPGRQQGLGAGQTLVPPSLPPSLPTTLYGRQDGSCSAGCEETGSHRTQI